MMCAVAVACMVYEREGEMARHVGEVRMGGGEVGVCVCAVMYVCDDARVRSVRYLSKSGRWCGRWCECVWVCEWVRGCVCVCGR